MVYYTIRYRLKNNTEIQMLVKHTNSEQTITHREISNDKSYYDEYIVLNIFRFSIKDVQFNISLTIQDFAQKVTFTQF